MKKLISYIFFFTMAFGVFSQEAFDLLRYSSHDIFGTARSMSMANAFGAMGGDMAAISINPAGLGIYRRSEIVYVPVAYDTYFESAVGSKDYSSEGVSKGKTANFGVVCAYPADKDSKWGGYNIAVSYNRLKSFDRNSSIQKSGSNNSLLDHLTAESKMEDMAYDAYLLDLNYQPIPQRAGEINNWQNTVESGGIDVWDFSYAFNYGYFLYMGVSFGVEAVSYSMDTYYGESFSGDGSFHLWNELSTSGTGVNAKLGVIVRPFPALRLGFAFHSPTYYDLVDSYDASLTSSNVPDDNGVNKTTTVYVSENKPDKISYKLETPSHYIYSAALQVGRKGFVSVDYERIDYSRMLMRDGVNAVYGDVAQDVNSYFKAVGNLRVGLERRLSDCVSVRCGYAYYPSPIKSEVKSMAVHTPSTMPNYSIDGDSHYISGGIGFRFNIFFFDMALVNQSRKATFYPYHNAEGVATRTNTFSYVSSLGLRF